jgi:hypothetical protein
MKPSARGSLACLACLAALAGLLVGLPSCKAAPEIAADAGASQAASPAKPSHVVVVDAPPAGDVDEIVRGALVRAAAEKRTLVVYVGATWCEPCRYFHEAAARGDLDAELPAVTLLDFDLDRDRERLAMAGYVSKYIPLFALPRADGQASGKQIEGGIKGDGAVGYIVPRLVAMLGS